MIPLVLEKEKSILDGLKLVEVNDKLVINALLKSDLLLKHWDKTNYQHIQASQNYANEFEQLKTYSSKNKNNVVIVNHKKPKHGWGRPYIEKSLGFTAIRQKVRNTLMNDKYYDLDLENAQIVILKNICESNKIKCPELDKYINHREDILNQVKDTYDVCRGMAKKLFLRLAFKGTFEGWMEDVILMKKQIKENLAKATTYNVETETTDTEITDDTNEEGEEEEAPPKPQTYKRIKFIDDLETELEKIAQKIKQSNPDLYETARKTKIAKGEKNFIGSFFALYLQEYEARIIGNIVNWLINETNLTKKKGVKGDVLTYEYDGLKILKYNVNKFEGGLNGLIETLNKKTTELTGFKLNWVEKPITGENSYDLKELMEEIDNEEINEDNDKNETTLSGDIDYDLLNFRNEIHDLYMSNHLGIAELVNKISPNTFFYHFGEWYGWNGKKWEKSVLPLKRCIMYDIKKYLLDKYTPFKELYDKIQNDNVNFIAFKYLTERLETDIIKNKLSDNMQISNIVNIAVNIMTNDYLKFDDNRDLLGFNNCVYDIINDELRPYKYDDYVTMSCGYDMEDLREKEGTRDLTDQDYKCYEELDKVFMQILPDKEIRQLVLLICASGLSGMCIEKFYIFNGGGGNGKSWLNEFMGCLLGDYYYKADTTLLTQKNKDAKGANPELAGLDKKRYVVYQEPAFGQKLENSNIKDQTGGGELKGRVCYSNKTKIELHNTTIIECNERPLLKEEPTQADIRRICDILFSSSFTENEDEINEANNIFKANPTLKSKAYKEEHRIYFMNILFTAIQQLKEKNYTFDEFMPETVKERSKAYLQSCYEIHSIFTSLYEKVEVTPDTPESKIPFISLNAVVKQIKASEYYESLTKAKKREYTNDYIKKFFENNKLYKKTFKAKHNFYDEYGKRKTINSIILGYNEKQQQAPDDDMDEDDITDDNEEGKEEI